jgi:hypothetical protein
MDVVVQENASQTEALSATALTLAMQAAHLQALVGRFVLERGTDAAAPARAPAPAVADATGGRARRLLPKDARPALVSAGNGSGRVARDVFDAF